MAPLDRVKILFQASNPHFTKYAGSWFGLAMAMKDIRQHEGFVGLFKGHSATLLRIFPYAGIKFLAYEQIRAFFIPTRDRETPIRRLLSGSFAGLSSVFVTYPLELLRVRMAFETKQSSGRSSLLQICRQIYRERVSAPVVTSRTGTVSSSARQTVPSYGLTNFYRGFTPTVLGMFPYAGVSFLTHDTVGDWLRHPSIAKHTTIPNSDTRKRLEDEHLRVQLTATAELFSGAVAGVVAQTSSYPFEVLRRRMQVSGAVGDGLRRGIADTARKVWGESGFRGFWVGLTIGYLKVIPMGATSFFTYERLKWRLGI